MVVGELIEGRFWRGREGVAVARVVCVHGVGQQLKGEDSLAGEWALALRDGMRRAGCAESRLPGAWGDPVRVLWGCVPPAGPTAGGGGSVADGGGCDGVRPGAADGMVAGRGGI